MRLKIGSQKSILGFGTPKTMDAFVAENNWAKVVVKLTNFNVFLSHDLFSVCLGPLGMPRIQLIGH